MYEPTSGSVTRTRSRPYAGREPAPSSPSGGEGASFAGWSPPRSPSRSRPPGHTAALVELDFRLEQKHGPSFSIRSKDILETLDLNRFRKRLRGATIRRAVFKITFPDDKRGKRIELTDEDVRQYEVSLPKLAARIRRESDISGTGAENHEGLVALGQKTVDAFGTVDVYLSLPNEDESALLSGCRRLERPPGSQRVVLVTPRGMSVSPEGRRILDSSGVLVVSLIVAASKGNLELDWNNVVRRPTVGLGQEYPKDKRIFQNQGETWLVVYDGIPKSINHMVGMSSHPNPYRPFALPRGTHPGFAAPSGRTRRVHHYRDILTTLSS